MADFFELLNMIQTQHPDIMAILQKPGVFKVAMDMEAAEAAGTPWSDARLKSALEATEYYRTNDEQQRNWDALLVTDPASATTKIEATRRIIADLESQLGIHFDTSGGLSSMGFWLLNTAVRSGWTPEQIKYNMLASVNKSITGGGDLGAMAVNIKHTMDDYGVPMSDTAIMGWASKLAQGAVDDQAILGYAQQQAMSLFPGLKDAISRGVTVRQYADPYMQIAQQELGIDPKSQSFTDPKWMRAINSVDPKTGQRVSMSLSDWTAVIRSDPKYGFDKTEKAATQGANFATDIGRMMGAVG